MRLLPEKVVKGFLRKIPGFSKDASTATTFFAILFYVSVAIVVLALLIPTTPRIEVAGNQVTNKENFVVEGTTSSDKPVYLYNDGELVTESTSDSNGKFVFNLEELEEGEYTYKIEVCDTEEKERCSTKNIKLLVDMTPPETPEVEPVPEESSEKTIQIKGTAEPGSTAKILINGGEASVGVSSEGIFSRDISLHEGLNDIRVYAEDKAGNKSEQTEAFSVNYTKRTVKVVRVIDGDTIEIEGGDTVRYIGIDAPETVDPNTPEQCYGKEASDRNKDLVEGKEVQLEKDISETDRYGRLLRYVWVDGSLVNELLVEEGFATSSTYPPDVKYQDRFTEAERQAREQERGLWSNYCDTWGQSPTPEPTVKATTSPVYTSTPAPTPYSTTEPTTSDGGSCLYSCSGPDKDCGHFTSHSQAQNFFNCCGFSASYDPMRLDGDNDGLACESI